MSRATASSAISSVSSQFFRGDEGNDDRPLAGYAVVNLRTGYKVIDNVEVYGLVKNLFNNDYATLRHLLRHRCTAQRRWRPGRHWAQRNRA